MRAMICTTLALGLFCTGLPARAADVAGDMHELLWGKLLAGTVVEGSVNYRAFKERVSELDSYLAILNAADAGSMSREEQLALWINAYNAYTIKLIVENYPLRGIREIADPWKQKRWKVGGKSYSLDEMEHRFLRDELKEPRIHFAIVCASIGCPDLWNRPYTAKGIDEQLDAAARRFMQSSKHVQTANRKGLLGREIPVLKVSAIFRWFKGDFVSEKTRRLADYVQRYATPEVQAFIEKADSRLEIDYLPYDWGLNGK